MDYEKSLNFLNQVFSRFLISGLVFVIFTILLPAYSWQLLTGNILSDGLNYPHLVESLKKISLSILKISDKTTLIILLSLSIGIFLDFLKFYNFAIKILLKVGIPQIDFKIKILRAFHIDVDESKKNETGYAQRLRELADKIHEVFIKVHFPQIDQRIKNSRIYPEILSISFTSILLGCGYLAFMILLLLAYNFISPEVYLVFITVCLIMVITWFYGKKKVKREYEMVTPLTIELIENAFHKSNGIKKDELERFFKKLENIELITKNSGGWQVNGEPCCGAKEI
ncbi:MAG TPA: hypothetical protein VK186_26405 [Candidatus Deferrimicrobium sp.]|nr:hypothetical protein [Candidatus Deferrimicrobium sp.]